MNERNNREESEMGIPEILKIIEKGPFEARGLTKKRTHQESKELKEIAWKSIEEISKTIADAFFNSPPPKKYTLTKQGLILLALFVEFNKTSANAFRLAEEGYYRSAFGESRDLLELVMKIKLFYEFPESLQEWVRTPNKLFTTKRMRKHRLFQNSELNEEIKKLSNTFSNNRHCSVRNLDAFGKVMTNVPYYRKDLFEKWCKHIILMKELSIKIINSDAKQINESIVNKDL